MESIEYRNLKRVKRQETVLDEDTMRNCVEKIIQRDYFPDLNKIEQLKQFLNSENELVKMVSVFKSFLDLINMLIFHHSIIDTIEIE